MVANARALRRAKHGRKARVCRRSRTASLTDRASVAHEDRGVRVKVEGERNPHNAQLGKLYFGVGFRRFLTQAL
jgi:hypothetical protein